MAVPPALYQLFGALLCGFVLFIPIGIAYMIARRIQKAVWKKQEDDEVAAEPI